MASLVDGTLSPVDLAALHEHVAGCRSCGELVTELALAGGDEPRAASGGSRSEYVLGERIGQGGMGVVYRATDGQLARTVAVKFLAHGDDDETVAAALEARFVREARLTARLQHPAIVPIYQTGRWPSGEIFYAMKLISGRSLRELVAQAATERDRLALLPHVIAAADAVAYAHEQRVVHRDLKPANIMVGAFGETVVIDWGLAKDLAAGEGDTPAAAVDDGNDETLTRAGAVLGTPGYMAPEQRCGGGVDERADVYALGAILHHVLTGAAPGTSRPRSTRRELDAIVDKATRADPSARYPSARELVADLRRFQTGQLVAAHAYTVGARLRRWLWRHRAAAVVAATLLVLLTVAETVSLRRIARERAGALAARDALLLAQAVTQLDRDPTATVAWLKRYPAGAQDAARVADLAVDAAMRGVARHVFRVRDAGGTFGDFSRDGTLFAGRDGDRICVRDTASGRLVASLPWPHHRVMLRFSPDARRLAVVGMAEDATPVSLWSFAGDGAVRTLAGDDGHADVVAWSPDGALLASAGWDGVVRLWDATRGTARALRGHRRPVARLAFSDDGRTLVSCSDDALWRWQVDSGRGEELLVDHRLSPVFATARDRIVALGDDAVHLFSGDGAHARFLLPDGGARALALDGDGRVAVVGGSDGAVRLVSLDDGRWRTLGNQRRGVTALAVARDGAFVVTGSADGVARLWTATGGERAALRAAVDGAVDDVVLSRDGRWLSTSATDHTERVWRVPSAAPVVLGGHDNVVHQVLFAPDGRTLATASSDERVLLHTRDGRLVRALAGHSDHVFRLAWSPDGARLASSSFDGSVRLWNVADGAATVWRGHTAPVLSLAFAGDGAAVFSGSLDGTVRAWDVAGGPARTWAAAHGPIAALARSPDDRVIVAGADDGSVVAWSWRDGVSRLVHRHGAAVRGVAFADGGRLVVSGDGQGALAVTPAAGGAARTWQQANEVVAPTVSPAGDVFATGDGESVRLWRLDGTPLARLDGHSAAVWCLAFSPDGRLLASGGFDGTVRVWNVPSGQLRAVLRTDARVSWVTFSPDGRALAASSFDGSARVWPLEDALAPTLDGAAARGFLDALTSAVVDAADQATTPATTPSTATGRAGSPARP